MVSLESNDSPVLRHNHRPELKQHSRPTDESEKDCNDDEEETTDDSAIAITIPKLGWDLDMANSNQRLNKTSPAHHS